jgi:hypothetical protein
MNSDLIQVIKEVQIDDNTESDTYKSILLELKEMIAGSPELKLPTTPASDIKDIDEAVSLFGLDYFHDPKHIWQVPDVPDVALSKEVGMDTLYCYLINLLM